MKSSVTKKDPGEYCSRRGLIVKRVSLRLGHRLELQGDALPEMAVQGFGQRVGKAGVVGVGAFIDNLPEGGDDELPACSHDQRGVDMVGMQHLVDVGEEEVQSEVIL